MSVKSYLLSVPERVLRAAVGLGAGMAREAGQVALPEGVRRSQLYQNLVDSTLRFLIEQVGGVEGLPGGEGAIPDDFIARRTAGNVVEALGIVAFRAFVRTDEGQLTWDRFRLSIPGYGRIRRHQYYAQFSRTLGTLMENGIPLLKGLDLVTEIAANKYLESKLREVRRAVIDGANLSSALAKEQLFPELFTDMMAVGEQTGHFAQTMQTIADVYERELDRTVNIISTLIPPVIIVLIAIVVGFVVYSILSAVFEMTHSLQVRPQ